MNNLFLIGMIVSFFLMSIFFMIRLIEKHHENEHVSFHNLSACDFLAPLKEFDLLDDNANGREELFLFNSLNEKSTTLSDLKYWKYYELDGEKAITSMKGKNEGYPLGTCECIENLIQESSHLGSFMFEEFKSQCLQEYCNQNDGDYEGNQICKQKGKDLIRNLKNQKCMKFEVQTQESEYRNCLKEISSQVGQELKKNLKTDKKKD